LKKLAISSLGLARFKQYGAFPPRNIFSPAFRFTRQQPSHALYIQKNKC